MIKVRKIIIFSIFLLIFTFLNLKVINNFFYTFLSLIVCITLNIIIRLILFNILKEEYIIKYRILIKNIHCMKQLKKICYISLKLVIYIVLGLIFNLLYNKFNVEYSEIIRNMCLQLIILNLLPIFPMTVGELIIIIFSRFVGNIKALKLMNNFSKLVSYIIILLGVISMIIYPYNISLFLFGLYIKYMNNCNYFYEYIYTSLFFNNYKKNKVNTFYIDGNLNIIDVLEKIKFDKKNIICTIINGECIAISEEWLKAEILKGNAEKKLNILLI